MADCEYIAEQAQVEKRLRGNRRVLVNGRNVLVSQLYQNPGLQEKLVIENPEQALRLYDLDKNERLGRVFALTYNGHSEYGASALQIGKELRIPDMKQPRSRVKQEALEAEHDRYLPSRRGSGIKARSRH